jgi:hypothetical protein
VIGGIVTRMTVIAATGAITEINIEIDGDKVEFPETIIVDLNCKINLQKMIRIGGQDESKD